LEHLGVLADYEPCANEQRGKTEDGKPFKTCEENRYRDEDNGHPR
jgi:hypothetical protein